MGRRALSEAVDPRWFEGFFGEDWLRIARAVDDERTERQVDFLVEKLGLEPGARILDLGCGHGRHSIPLAGRGYRVTGFDLSETSLEHARRAASDRGVELGLVHGDMRELPFEGAFDAAINVYTSFGYFADERDNELVLERVARALVPGGRFVLDTFNLLALARGFRPQAWSELGEGWLMVDEREYDPVSGRNTATWMLVGPAGERRELRHSVRAYTCPELIEKLRRAGLEPDGVWGSFDGDEFGLDTWRIIVRSLKPGAAGPLASAQPQS